MFISANRERGINEHTFRSGLWRTWRSFQEEAGAVPNAKKRRFSDEVVFTGLARLTRTLRRIPGDDDLQFERRRDPSVPSVKVVRARAKTLAQRAAALREFCSARPGWEDLAPIIAGPGEDNDLDAAAENTDKPSGGFVYMIKYGRHYKVGCTNSTDRRMREIQLHLPSRTKLVHQIETDDPSGIEAYWHRRFESKRHRAEWFALAAAEIKAFRSRRFM